MSRDEIEQEAQGLSARLQEIKGRGDASLYPTEDAMEKASITVRLAALWELWQTADRECVK